MKVEVEMEECKKGGREECKKGGRAGGMEEGRGRGNDVSGNSVCGVETERSASVAAPVKLLLCWAPDATESASYPAL
jgi:hypothetical protein